MASPQSDSYSVSSGNTIIAGRFAQTESFNFSVLYSGMSDNTWQKLAMNNRIDDVWTPEAKRATGVASSHESALHGIIEAYCGVAIDTKRGRVIALGGGHYGYIGNEPYFADLSDRDWSRAGLPTAIISDSNPDPNVIYNVTNANSTIQNYPTLASHTYNIHKYLPWLDKSIIIGNRTYWEGTPSRPGGVDMSDTANLLPTGPWLLDPAKFDANKTVAATGTGRDPADLGAEMYENRDWPQNGLGYYKTRTICLDEASQRIYLIDSGSEVLRRLTVTADGSGDAMEDLGYASASSTLAGSCYIPHLDAVFYLATNGPKIKPCDYPNSHQTDIFPINLSDPDLPSWGVMGIDYDSVAKKILLWDGYAEIWEITVPDVLSSEGWILEKVTQGTGPTFGQPNGTYGKWYNVGNSQWIGVQDGREGQIWTYKARSAKPNDGNPHSKSDLSYSSTLKTIAGLTHLVALPFIEGSGSTTREFVSGSDIALDATDWASHNGETVVNSGLTIASDLGTPTAITVVFTIIKSANYDDNFQPILLSADGTTVTIGTDINDDQVEGTLTGTKSRLTSSYSAYDRATIAITAGGGTAGRLCINGEGITNCDTTLASIALGAGVKIFNAVAGGNPVQKGVLFNLMSGRATDAQLQALSINPIGEIYS